METRQPIQGQGRMDQEKMETRQEIQGQDEWTNQTYIFNKRSKTGRC